MSLISLKNVSKIYGEERTEIRALDNVNLEIEKGKIITIMGPSGSGKSTLLNLLGAMDSPTSGKIIVGGRDIGSLPERKLSSYRKETVGFVFQTFYLLPNLNVMDNILIPLIPYGIKSGNRKRAQELLDLVGLGNRGESKVGKLSGGESQRIAIARALINDPKVILADEPTGNLDSETGKSIVELLLKLAENEKTVVIVTHDPRIAQAVAEHPLGTNIWIKDGQLSEKPTYNMFCWGE
ncbi:MAG: putative ABC transporter ATP-binding protein [Promethearchaeota archaeon]|jgi:ABC-type lipoprotein export system ATPase subunit|nr:MAG: putative ABC transporter ATP-binding protein [Candidatus Lokiarchaeota archaeon]